MQNITIRYRTQRYSTDIDSSKTVLELKKEVSKLTGVSVGNFDLQLDKFILVNTKYINFYTNHGSIFTMVNVYIDVVVVLNDQRRSFRVNELDKIVDFIEEIIRSSGHSTEISLHYNNKQLVATDSIISSGVEQGSILTAQNGKIITSCIKRVTVTYRKKRHQIDIDETKSVSELKLVVSTLTLIKVEHFCLQLDNIYLSDEKKISVYIRDGSNYSMVNVTIAIYVPINGDEVPFYVKEESKIDDLKKAIIKKAGITGDITLRYHTGDLLGTSTVLEGGLITNTILLAVLDNVIQSGMKKLYIYYRGRTYEVDIDTSKTISDLKAVVSGLSEIKKNQFSLKIYFIRLEEEEQISKYMKYGTMLQMWEVTIDITVKLDGKSYSFSVKEEMTIDELILEIIRRSGKTNVSCLSDGVNTLVRSETLKNSGVENSTVLLAITTIVGADGGWGIE